MAFKKYAHSIVNRSNIDLEEWVDEIREQHETILPKQHIGRIAKTVLRKCDPKQYLLSHATIVASVDTYAPKNVKTGRMMNQGVQIDVKYPDYRIKPECHEIINNNNDSWERSLLLSTYRTFIGAENYCFVPGTNILMADGTLRAIEDIRVGDDVISHTGNIRRVLHKFERDYSGDIKEIYIGHRQTPVRCTPNHEFCILDRDICESCGKSLSTEGRPTSYKHRLFRNFCPDCGRRVHGKKTKNIKVRSVKADDLQRHNLVYSPIPKLGLQNTNEALNRYAKLLGYYLADGCINNNYIHYFLGSHEKSMFREIVDASRYLDPDSKTSLAVCSNTDNGIKVSVYSPQLSKRLLHDGGAISYNKHINNELTQSLSSEEIIHLIGGYVNGDGDIHKITNRHRAVSTSLALLEQIRYLALRAGLNSFIVPHNIKVGDKTEVMFKDGTTHVIECKHPAWVLHFDTDSSHKLNKVLDSAKNQVRKSQSGSFRFIDEKRIDSITKIDTNNYVGKVYNLEIDVDHSYIVDGIASVFQCEHIQLKELSKGFIVDAIARDLGNTCYIDILIATDRKHKILVQDILTGNIDSLSMGCVSLFTICNKCGNVASDDSNLCPCIQYEGKSTKFLDEDGVEHPIAELVGHVAVPNSCQFIEASWVGNPAFRGAVRRQILNPDMSMLSSKMEKASPIYELKKVLPVPDGVKKAASKSKIADSAGKVSQDAEGQMPPSQDSSLDDKDNSEMESGGDSGDVPDSGGTADAALDSADSKGEDSSPDFEEAERPSKEDKSEESINKMLDKAQEKIMEVLLDKLTDKLEPKPEDVGVVSPQPPSIDDNNDNLQHAAVFSRKVKTLFPHNPELVKWAISTYKIVHNGGQKAIIATGISARDLLVLSWIEDKVHGFIYPNELYKLSMRLGPLKTFPSERSFLAAGKIFLGKSLSKKEKDFLIWKGKIASIA